MIEFVRPYNVPSAFISMLLYLYSAHDRLLLANAMGLNRLLLGAISLGQLVPFLVCSKPASSHTSDASVSKYSGLVSL